MQIFKKLLGFIAANILVIFVFTMAFAQPSAVRPLLKTAKAGDYDTLILGQSNAETSVDPFLLSDLCDCNAFNLSRRLQPMVNQYYLLQEANKYGQYKTIILDLDISYWTEDHNGRAGTDCNLLFRLTGRRQAEYIRKILLDDNFTNAFFDYSLTPSQIPAMLKKVPMQLRTKCSSDYILGKESSIAYYNQITGITKNYKYIGRGFRYGIQQRNTLHPPYTFKVKDVKEENLEAFDDIVRYCNTQNIKLICIASAVPPYRLLTDNIDTIHNYFEEICRKYAVPFYDFSYATSQYLPRTDQDYVDLEGHMMGEMAEKQTRLLSYVLKANDPTIFFHKNYAAVLQDFS